MNGRETKTMRRNGDNRAGSVMRVAGPDAAVVPQRVHPPKVVGLLGTILNGASFARSVRIREEGQKCQQDGRDPKKCKSLKTRQAGCRCPARGGAQGFSGIIDVHGFWHPLFVSSASREPPPSRLRRSQPSGRFCPGRARANTSDGVLHPSGWSHGLRPDTGRRPYQGRRRAGCAGLRARCSALNVPGPGGFPGPLLPWP